MKLRFYIPLAWNNLKKNAKLYIPNILTGIGLTAVCDIMFTLSGDPRLQEVRGGRYLSTVMPLGVIVIAVLSFILILYTNSFLMKQRNRELGLYNVLGMEKRHIGKILFWETAICTLFVLIGGLLTGIILYKLCALLICRFLSVNSILGFYHVSPKTLIPTAIFFFVIYLLTYVFNRIRIARMNPTELLQSTHTGEKEPKVKWLLLLIGIGTLSAGYYISITTKNPLEWLYLFFAAIIFVIIGTYCLFITGSIALLKLMKRNQKFYYQKNHMVAVSGLLYRMKQNAVGLASICILCTCILVMLSSTVSLYFGIEDTITAYQQDSFQLKVYGYDDGTLPSDQEFAKFYSQMQTELENHDIGIDSFIHTKRYSVSVRFGNDHILAEDESGDFVVGYLVGMTQDEYNRAYHQNVQLSDQNILVSSNFFDFGDTLDIDQQKYPIQEVVHQPYLLPNENPTAQRNLIVIMKDEEAIQEMMSYFFGDTIQPTENLSIVYQDQSQEKEAEDILRKCLDNFVLETETEQGGISFYRSSLYEVRIMLMELYGSLFFLGIFLGILFLMATILIMYYKQLSEGYEDQKRFEIMQKVGMSTKEVKQTIRSQVLIFFFLPLIASVIHMAFAFHLITMMFSYIVLSGTEVFITCTIISVIIVAIVYAIVYVFTSRTYYRIVKN